MILHSNMSRPGKNHDAAEGDGDDDVEARRNLLQETVGNRRRDREATAYAAASFGPRRNNYWQWLFFVVVVWMIYSMLSHVSFSLFLQSLACETYLTFMFLVRDHTHHPLTCSMFHFFYRTKGLSQRCSRIFEVHSWENRRRDWSILHTKHGNGTSQSCTDRDRTTA